MSDATTITDTRASAADGSLHDGPASPADRPERARADDAHAPVSGAGEHGAAGSSSSERTGVARDRRVGLADAARSPIVKGAAVFLACMAVIVGLWQAAISAGLLTGLAPAPPTCGRAAPRSCPIPSTATVHRASASSGI